MEKAKAQGGPVVVVDSGNALWRNTGLVTQADTERAAFILGAMGRIGTDAMAPGAKDLVEGPAWLKAQADEAKVPVLSANLKSPDGQRVFPGSRLLTSGGAKVGIIGVSPQGALAPARGTIGPPAPAAISEAKALRADGAEVILVLAPLPYADALQFARDVGEHVDVVLQSHEGRGAGSAQTVSGNFVLPSGERGRQVGVLSLDRGKGPLRDAGEVARDQQTLKMLEGQIQTVKQRMAAAKDPEARAGLASSLKQFEARKKEVAARVAQGKGAGGRKLALDWWHLTSAFPSDAALEAQVKRYDTGASH